MHKLLTTPGERIELLRRSAGLQVQQLAKMLEPPISTAFMSQIERGTADASVKRLVQLAGILNTTTDYLLCLTDDPNRPGEHAYSDSEPVYFSEEADEVARMIDAMPAWKRVEALYMVRAAAAYTEEARRRAEAAAKEIAGRLRFAGAIVGDDAIDAIADALTRAWTNAAPD